MNNLLLTISLYFFLIIKSHGQITIQKGQHIFVNHAISAMSCSDCSLTFDWIVDMSLDQQEYIEHAGNTYMITPETEINFNFRIINDFRPDDNNNCSSYGQDYEKNASCNFCYQFIYKNYSYLCPLNEYVGIYIPNLVSHTHKVKPNCLLLTYTRVLIEDDRPKVSSLEKGIKGYVPPLIFKTLDLEYHWLLTSFDGKELIIKDIEELDSKYLNDIVTIQVVSKQIQSQPLILPSIL
ncbi:hypothetical protein [Flammeovirga pacifica]|uniref:Uncharacterized protein n=1 Tax=Flammeovirga pacifica TaxID=915059 RepID=A0A1S1Z2K3_FLAPC|nr:hypothetical protein [Flammeovirga pacifica]OHX67499.1 hypothetical protein NH26_14660 [Flammeovirga pacifica]